MFPEEWDTLDQLVFANARAFAAHQVITGFLVIILAINFAPYLVKAMLSLTGWNHFTKPVAQQWDDHDDLWDEDEKYRRDYNAFRHARNQRRWEGYYDPDEWHEVS